MPPKKSTTQTPTQLKKELGQVKEELDVLEEQQDDAKEELGIVEDQLSDVKEELLAAQLRNREMEQEHASRDAQDSNKTILLFLLSAVLVWVARLPDWRTTLGLEAFCPSSSEASDALWKFQAWLCVLLQSNGGELKLSAGIIWVLAMVIVLLGRECDSVRTFVGPAISLCVFMDSIAIDGTTTLAVIVLVLVYCCYLLCFGCATNISLQTKLANEAATYDSIDQVASDKLVVHRT